MRHSPVRIAVAALVLAGGGIVVAGPIGNSPPPQRGIVAQVPEAGPGYPPGPSPIPVPVPQPQVMQITTEDFQLVGFTQEAFPGNRGILNMSRACQLLYPASRVCTAQDVMQTVTIPEVPRHLSDRLVWVQTGGQTFPALAHLDATEAPEPTERAATEPAADAASDCHGWSSASGRELGLAIELGPDNGCFGGFMAAKCNMELAAACCSRQQLVPVQ